MAHGILVQSSSGTANLADLPAIRRIGTVDISFSALTRAGEHSFSTSGNADFNNGRPYTFFTTAGWKSGADGGGHTLSAIPAVYSRSGALPATVSVTYDFRRRGGTGAAIVQLDLFMLEG